MVVWPHRWPCMGATHAAASLGSRPLVDAALSGIDRDPDRGQAVLDLIVGLARQEGALALRLGMVLAWAKRQDPTVLGYPSFTAFCREHVEWSDSWLRDVVRLVESPLDLVKAAVCRDLLPLRVAVTAPGRVQPDEQAAWLFDPTTPRPEQAMLDRFEGDDAAVIHRARRLARLCLGRTASLREVDEFVIRCWSDRIPGEAVLAAAREHPERPQWEALSWAWCAEGSPAESLLGPWVEPTSLAEAARHIDTIEAIRRGRGALLARAWATADYYGLCHVAGFESQWKFADEVLGWSRRTAQRQKRIGWALEWYPELDQAVADGLDLGSVSLLAGIVSPGTVDRWVAVAHRVGQLELSEAIAAATTDRKVLDRYEAALADADRWAAPSAGGRVGVALPHTEPERPPDEVRGPPGLAEAARWFVENVRVEPQRGFARVKDRDGYRCQNPECGRVALRNEAHHIIPRSEGGSDEEANGITVCRACHLRGIHTADGRISVERATLRPGVEALVWRYAGGRTVVAMR